MGVNGGHVKQHKIFINALEYLYDDTYLNRQKAKSTRLQKIFKVLKDLGHTV